MYMVLRSTVSSCEPVVADWPLAWHSRIARQVKTAAWNWLGQGNTTAYRIALHQPDLRTLDTWPIRAAMPSEAAEGLRGSRGVEDVAKFLRLRIILICLLQPKSE